MTIIAQTATVYFGGRRRWFSLKGAARADAKLAIKQGGSGIDGAKYAREVTRLAGIACAEFVAGPVEVLAPELRALAACRELVAANSEVKRLSRQIGESLSECQMAKDATEYGPKGPITHLSLAYASESVENDNGWGGTHKEWNSQHLLDDCQHCMAAHVAIQERKVARKRLGVARRAVTMIGRAP